MVAYFRSLFLQLLEWFLFSGLTFQHTLSPSQLCAIHPCADLISTFSAPPHRLLINLLGLKRWNKTDIRCQPLRITLQTDTVTDPFLDPPCIHLNCILITSTSSEVVSELLLQSICIRFYSFPPPPHLKMPVKLVEKEIRLLLRFVSDKFFLWPLGIAHRWYFVSLHKCKRLVCRNDPWSSYWNKSLRMSAKHFSGHCTCWQVLSRGHGHPQPPTQRSPKPVRSSTLLVRLPKAPNLFYKPMLPSPPALSYNIPPEPPDF